VGVVKFYNPDELTVTGLNSTREEADGAYTSFAIPQTPIAIVQQPPLLSSGMSAG